MFSSIYKSFLKFISVIAFIGAVYSANASSIYLIYQREVPNDLKKLRKF